jgi:predicted TIM-barrel fold metal-dependent hydrolase
VIDVHVHAFPDAASGRRWQTSAEFEPERPGTIDDLGPRMAEAGIEQAVLLMFGRPGHRARELREQAGPSLDEAVIRDRVASGICAYNRWGCELAARDPRFRVFVGVDPQFLSADELVAEIRAGAAAGASGVKLVPPAMSLYPDDPLLEPVHATCVELGLPILSQSGAGGSAPPGPRGHFGHPAGWKAVLDRHPGLSVVLAHLGRGYDDELVDLVRRHETVMADTSLRLGSPRDDNPWGTVDVLRTTALIRRLGAERVLFGSNYPITDPVAYADRLGRLGLTDRELALIGRENALRLLG